MQKAAEARKAEEARRQEEEYRAEMARQTEITCQWEEAERQRVINEAWEQMEQEQQEEMQTWAWAITITQGSGMPGPSTAVVVLIARVCYRCTLLLKEPKGCMVREKGKAQACLLCQKVCKVCMWGRKADRGFRQGV